MGNIPKFKVDGRTNGKRDLVCEVYYIMRKILASVQRSGVGVGREIDIPESRYIARTSKKRYASRKSVSNERWKGKEGGGGLTPLYLAQNRSSPHLPWPPVGFKFDHDRIHCC